MESACDKHTGEVIDAELLWIIVPVDPMGYECRGCGALVTPCSYRPENKVRPYFSAKDGHHAGCDVDGEVELVKRARKQRISTREGFPGSFPNRLVLRDTREVVDSNGTPTVATSAGGRIGSKGSSERQWKRHWTAQTIRPICRTFVNYPYDRDLLLEVPGIAGGTYERVFRSLKRDQKIIRYPEPRLFYGPIDWAPLSRNDDLLEIQLYCGEWIERKCTRPYRVRMSWKDWSDAKRRYVSREIRTAREEYMAAYNLGNKEKKGWLFFIGRQDESDSALFHVDDHRLVCCMVAEIIYAP